MGAQADCTSRGGRMSASAYHLHQLPHYGRHALALDATDWVCADLLAHHFAGRSTRSWLCSDLGMRYVAAEAERLQAKIPERLISSITAQNAFAELRRALTNAKLARWESGDPKRLGGCWLSPGLAVPFARWIGGEGLADFVVSHLATAPSIQLQAEAVPESLHESFAGWVPAATLAALKVMDTALSASGVSVAERRRLLSDFAQASLGEVAE